jgi:hypothetical protein
LAGGSNALFANTTGYSNVASGVNALTLNTTGISNLGTGNNSLFHNTSGRDNVGSGESALFSNTTGNNNLAGGTNALHGNTTGSANLGLGRDAGNNLTTGSNNVDIANRGVAGESGAIRIGTTGNQSRAFLAGVSGVSIAGPTQTVLVNSAGQLGTAVSSSARLKQDVRGVGAAAGRVLALRAVSYRYKPAYAHGANPTQYGLIAEQVAHHIPALVQYAPNGTPSGVYYQELPVLLLAQIQHQQHQIQHQQAQINWLMHHTHQH